MNPVSKISLNLIKELRKITFASISDCKKALLESKGDVQEAVRILRKLGLEIVSARQDQVAKEGRIESYVHLGNKIGVLVEVDCETDFVAKNNDFSQFAKDIAMQIAASNPLYLKREDIPHEVLEEEKDKEFFLKNNCLLEQPFIKDPSITIKDYLGNCIAKFGEKIVIRRFIRYQIGQ